MRDKNLKTKGNSYLFFYVILYSYANFRTSYIRIASDHFTVYPGHWICRMSEIQEWFRLKNQKQVLATLDSLTEKGLIAYKLHQNGKIVNFKIKGWKESNLILEYNAPCQKETGFFFFSIANALKLVDDCKCSEADILMDIWLNTILNDLEVKGSHIGPIVYFRGMRESALISNSEMAKCWGVSRTTVYRVLKRLEEMDFIDVIHFTGASGSVIYTKKYMQTMFDVEEVYIDRNDVVTVFETAERIQTGQKSSFMVFTTEELVSANSAGSEKESIGSKWISMQLVQKVREKLIETGFSEFLDKAAVYKLSTLSSDCKEYIKYYILTVELSGKEWHFQIAVESMEDG